MPTMDYAYRPAESSFKELFRVIFRHRRKVIRFFLAVMTLVIVATFLMPERFESEAKLLVRLGRESVTLDPTASTGQTVSISQSRSSEINSELEILSSPELAFGVVDALGSEVMPSPGLLDRLGIHPRGDARSRAAAKIGRNLHVEVLKDSNVLIMSYKDKNAERAQKVLAKLTDLYLDKHIAAHRTAGSYTFFENETAAIKKNLDEAEAKMRDYKNETNIVSLEEQRRNLSTRIAMIQQELDTTNTGLSSSQAKVRALQGMLSGLSDSVVTSTMSVPNSGLDQMQAKLYELQLREKDTLSKYREDSEPAKEIHWQVQQAQQLIADTENHRLQTTTALNPTHQQVKNDMLGEQAIMSALKAKAGSLTNEMRNVSSELKKLNDIEAEIGGPARELDLQREKYKKYSGDLEQARIDQALERDRISNISIVQPATLNPDPVSPRKGLNLMLGLFLGAFGGIGLAFFSEFMDHTLKRPIEIEERLGLPALLDIPHLGADRALPALTSGQKEPPLLPAGTESSKDGEVSKELLVPVKVNAYFEILRDHLASSTDGSMAGSSVLAVTSCRKGEGVSTVAASLAATVRREGTGRVLLVDARGLRKSEANGNVMVPGYEIHAGGDYVAHEHRMYESTSITDLLALLKREFSFVVVDTPAIFETAAAVRVCSMADDVLLVVESEKTPWEVAQEAKRVLERANAHLIGVVLNKRRYHVPEWLYQKL